MVDDTDGVTVTSPVASEVAASVAEPSETVTAWVTVG
jgi:hypothetical protein